MSDFGDSQNEPAPKGVGHTVLLLCIGSETDIGFMACGYLYLVLIGN